MATNLDVDIAAIESLMVLGGFKSKREAVDAAIREAISWRQQLKALDALGTLDLLVHPRPGSLGMDARP
ncbi:MAG TPA: type II toxin-antitoxin system VapB family antitoxin [Planctomycetota bacterium]|nr:type II toxin-antitoxin system VapB family antitoxin [Planctomycetota bacterium]